MRFAFGLAGVAAIALLSACSGGNNLPSVEELEERHGNRRDVTEDWLVGRWAEANERDCDRYREFQQGGDYREDRGDGDEWRLRDGRRDEMTLEIGRDEYRAERYGSTLVLIDDRDELLEYKKCGDSERSGSGDTAERPATPATPAPAPATPADPQLASELAAGVQEIKGSLPIRNGPMTMTDVYSNGAQLTMVGNVTVDLAPAQWTAIETNIRQSNCTGPFGPFIRRGATIAATISDSAGETRTISSSSCP